MYYLTFNEFGFLFLNLFRVIKLYYFFFTLKVYPGIISIMNYIIAITG